MANKQELDRQLLVAEHQVALIKLELQYTDELESARDEIAQLRQEKADLEAVVTHLKQQVELLRAEATTTPTVPPPSVLPDAQVSTETQRRVLEALTNFPDAPLSQIAELTNVSSAYVSRIRKAGRESGVLTFQVEQNGFVKPETVIVN